MPAVRFCSSPIPTPSVPSASSTGDAQEDWERETTLLMGRGGKGGQGAKSYDGEQTWSSVNQSILSGKRFRVAVQWITCPRGKSLMCEFSQKLGFFRHLKVPIRMDLILSVEEYSFLTAVIVGWAQVRSGGGYIFVSLPEDGGKGSKDFTGGGRTAPCFPY